jgi:hypothetical protein
MEYLKSTVLPTVVSAVGNTVKDKVISYAKDYLCDDEPKPSMSKKSIPKISRKMGMGQRPIRRMGVSGQPALRKMGM